MIVPPTVLLLVAQLVKGAPLPYRGTQISPSMLKASLQTYRPISADSRALAIRQSDDGAVGDFFGFDSSSDSSDSSSFDTSSFDSSPFDNSSSDVSASDNSDSSSFGDLFGLGGDSSDNSDAAASDAAGDPFADTQDDSFGGDTTDTAGGADITSPDVPPSQPSATEAPPAAPSAVDATAGDTTTDNTSADGTSADETSTDTTTADATATATADNAATSDTTTAAAAAATADATAAPDAKAASVGACGPPGINAATPAPDPIGLPTVGFGHLCKTKGCSEVPFPFPLTQSTASQLLQSDVKPFVACINGAVSSNVVLNDNQLGALTSWSFNVGCGAAKSSTLVKRLNAGENPNTVAAQELPKFNKAGGKVLGGLTRRRAAEVKLFQTPSDVKAHPC
ncbi:putative phage lysozyme [Lyophyllum shimeji]|uniref:Phage lysozyme n=1 Tax=Lyophyllum shimeji TaxID=47721 RepID=A0A9P3PZN6_LYOSH|nr:putative phage lysozyme [Lyophyllum shimeji]